MNPTERAAGGPVFLAVALVWIVALAGSGIAPRDRGTWLLEVAPVLIALPLLWATRKSFDFTPLAYALIGLHGLILIVGGMYTYAHVPAGFWVQEWLGLDRNPYDRLGHLAISAFYEMIEWWAALVLGQGAEEFLGTQGDPWDTQWDMFLALVGAATAQLLLSRPHDRQVAAATKRQERPT